MDRGELASRVTNRTELGHMGTLLTVDVLFEVIGACCGGSATTPPDQPPVVQVQIRRRGQTRTAADGRLNLIAYGTKTGRSMFAI